MAPGVKTTSFRTLHRRPTLTASRHLQESGGGVFDESGYFTLLSGNNFIQNYAPLGGAVALDDSYATVASPNVFTRNIADSVLGGAGIRVANSPSDGTTNFCPSQPAGIVVPGAGGVVNSSECSLNVVLRTGKSPLRLLRHSVC